MSIKDILIHMDASKYATSRLAAAIALAQQHEAHVTGLYVVPHPYIPAYVGIDMPSDIVERQIAADRKRAAEIGADFKAQTERAGVASEWRTAEGSVGGNVEIQARYADLVVVGQQPPDEDSGGLVADVADELLLSAGRPLLVVPYTGMQSSLGKTVMVAWNSTREATRAVHDALPILKRADKVIVFSVNADDAGHVAGADICTHLARHGVRAEAHHTVVGHDGEGAGRIGGRGIDVGNVLVSALSDHGADLLVMGAYGHSRFRELVLGGATRVVLQSMTVPVLMSH